MVESERAGEQNSQWIRVETEGPAIIDSGIVTVTSDWSINERVWRRGVD